MSQDGLRAAALSACAASLPGALPRAVAGDRQLCTQPGGPPRAAPEVARRGQRLPAGQWVLGGTVAIELRRRRRRQPWLPRRVPRHATAAQRTGPGAVPGPSAGAVHVHGARVLLLGGAGRIGTAAAVHLIQQAPGPLELLLAGRDEARGASALEEICAETAGPAQRGRGATSEEPKLSFRMLDWTVPGALRKLLEEVRVDAVLHTAGPFDEDLGASVLEAVIAAGVPVYVDVADPVEYIAAARALANRAREAGTMALVCAGAFPGFSNVLAVECARRLCPRADAEGGPGGSRAEAAVVVEGVDFAYFTAGLGGSGPVNLLITNLGFGTPVPVFRGGSYAPQMIAGASPRRVAFFLDEQDPAREAVGERDVWSWPFPEAATVAEHLGISGDSNSGMGTAPGIWNTVLTALVALVPREFWQARWFSEGLAWFSLPMVWLTDRFVRETHAMRVRVTASDGRESVAVQAHKSFRRCVAQSAAEFALELLERRAQADSEDSPWRPGVWLPEELADDDARRPRLLERLASTEGTISCGFRVH